MDEQTTAAEALQQALKTEFSNGDAGAPEQGGQTNSSVAFVPKAAKVEAKDTAATNDDAKKKRISDTEWQEMAELAKKGQQADDKLQKLKDALIDAPPAIQQEQDPLAQIQALKELVERREWEGDHPIVKSEKYREAWQKVNDDPQTRGLPYDLKWKLIKAEPESHAREEWKAQQFDVPQPLTSKGAAVTQQSSSALAADLLRQAGYSDDDMQKNGLKL